MPRTETLLFTIDENNDCRIGLLPASPEDNYHKNAKLLGKLENVSHVFFNPKGQMFVVRGDELFKGSAPGTPWQDWFKLAKRVGKVKWDQCKFLFFSPAGNLFAVNKSGALFKGPEPDNEHVPWIKKKATKIGASRWEEFDSLFFDPDGTMYGVYEGALRRNYALSAIDGRWLEQSFIVGAGGWDKLSHFIGFSTNGKLWCVSRDDGAMYTDDPPTDKDFPWMQRARNMGTDYCMYKSMSFTEDKIIAEVLSVNFLTDIGEIMSVESVVVKEEVHDNKGGTTPLKTTFIVDKVYITESEFINQHGMEFSPDAKATLESLTPIVAEAEILMSVMATNPQNLSFVEKNSTKTHLKMVSQSEVEPGTTVRETAVVQKANIAVPYTASVITQFGYKVVVSGTWTGATYFDLMVNQIEI